MPRAPRASPGLNRPRGSFAAFSRPRGSPGLSRPRESFGALNRPRGSAGLSRFCGSLALGCAPRGLMPAFCRNRGSFAAGGVRGLVPALFSGCAPALFSRRDGSVPAGLSRLRGPIAFVTGVPCVTAGPRGSVPGGIAVAVDNRIRARARDSARSRRCSAGRSPDRPWSARAARRNFAERVRSSARPWRHAAGRGRAVARVRRRRTRSLRPAGSQPPAATPADDVEAVQIRIEASGSVSPRPLDTKKLCRLCV